MDENDARNIQGGAKTVAKYFKTSLFCNEHFLAKTSFASSEFNLTSSVVNESD